MVKDVVIDAVDRPMGLDPQSGQIRHNVANGSPVATTATFLGTCVAQALRRGDGPCRSLHASV